MVKKRFKYNILRRTKHESIDVPDSSAIRSAFDRNVNAARTTALAISGGIRIRLSNSHIAQRAAKPLQPSFLAGRAYANRLCNQCENSPIQHLVKKVIQNQYLAVNKS